MLFRLCILAVSIFFTVSAHAQKVEKVDAEYIYYVPDNVSLEDAKQTAIERAKIQSIADAFGTVVMQSNTTFVSNQDGRSSSDIFSIGSSDVKGEWIETIGEPKYDIYYAQNTLVVEVSVQGRIREIVTATIDYDARLLRNGTEDRFESCEFRDGDDMYLSFKSPISGYLAVYLVDMENVAYCLLPYRNQSDGVYRIQANQRYLFFSTEDALDSECQLVDEYMMTCSGSVEQNIIYIVFSPNQFARAVDEDIVDDLSHLNYEDFQNWIVRCRRQDAEMNIRSLPIVIRK